MDEGEPFREARRGVATPRGARDPDLVARNAFVTPLIARWTFAALFTSRADAARQEYAPSRSRADTDVVVPIVPSAKRGRQKERAFVSPHREIH